MRRQKIIVVGATGKVGREMLSILLERGVPQENVSAAASHRSVGSTVSYGDSVLVVQDIADVDFSNYNIALFSAGSEVSKEYAIKASDFNCIVVDNTSYFRMFDHIPLIVPEINFDCCLKNHDSKIIANPNCSTIQTVMVLKPLHDAFGLKEVVISTYQSVSGAGQKGVSELVEQTERSLLNQEITPNHFKKQIAFNVIPQIDSFHSSLYTKEELKMMEETKKILGLDDLDITATCVRVPVMVGHAVSVFAKFERDVGLEEARELINNFPGVSIMDEPEACEYATPIDSASKDDVFVSRIRKHPTISNGISFWCVADNVRKGAALNAVQIAEKLFHTSLP